MAAIPPESSLCPSPPGRICLLVPSSNKPSLRLRRARRKGTLFRLCGARRNWQPLWEFLEDTILPALWTTFTTEVSIVPSSTSRMMEGADSLPRFSPHVLVASPDFREAAPMLPPVTLYHGTADISIPWTASQTFGEALRGAGVAVCVRILEGKTHTDLIIQDLMRGGRDELLEEVLAMIVATPCCKGRLMASATSMAYASQVDSPRLRSRMVPEFLIQAARLCSPF
eukprot:TRINITY_DN7801_c0_g1_i1.p1 TRINITY_DN7801_c0_g1~~TRINITY_DN7801_c0_g1_i1.p1  ORF type:complete len:227 (-),score=36.85 TRINITY_DN7801_c0_g1_i1:949-1629(-)